MYDFGRFESFCLELGKSNVFGQYTCPLQISEFFKRNLPSFFMCDVFLAIESCSKTMFSCINILCVFVILRYVGSTHLEKKTGAHFS